jgi:glycosyltransferase involved in cell wall biosynthesis
LYLPQNQRGYRKAFFEFRELMSQRLRILLLIPHLGGGGAEQVTGLLACGLTREKYELHLGLVTQAGADTERLPPWVTVHALGAGRVRDGALRLLGLVRRLKPEVILSGMAHLNFLVLLLRPFFPKNTGVLVRQNATVSSALAFGGLPIYTRPLYRMLYRRADRVICQSRSMAADLAAELQLREELIAVLPNPVDVDGIRNARGETVKWQGGGPHLLAVGRLAREKGFDLLLRAFSKVRAEFPGAVLTILGTGPEEFALKRLGRELEIEGAVDFPGYVDRPYAYYAGATLFALSSRHEGMPNALLEAAAAGLPIVALPSSGGVVEFLRTRPGAWLAADITAGALAGSLLKALRVLGPGQRFERATFASTAQASPTPVPIGTSNPEGGIEAELQTIERD